MVELIPVKDVDGEKIYLSWSHNIENFKYLNFGFHNDVDEANNFVKEFLSNNVNHGFHIVINKEIIGFCRATIKQEQAHIGYIIDKKYCGKGYATQAVKKLINILSKKDIKLFYATCHKDNVGSHQVVKNSGFKLTNKSNENYVFTKANT